MKTRSNAVILMGEGELRGAPGAAPLQEAEIKFLNSLPALLFARRFRIF